MTWHPRRSLPFSLARGGLAALFALCLGSCGRGPVEKDPLDWRRRPPKDFLLFSPGACSSEDAAQFECQATKARRNAGEPFDIKTRDKDVYVLLADLSEASGRRFAVPKNELRGTFSLDLRQTTLHEALAAIPHAPTFGVLTLHGVTVYGPTGSGEELRRAIHGAPRSSVVGYLGGALVMLAVVALAVFRATREARESKRQSAAHRARRKRWWDLW